MISKPLRSLLAKVYDELHKPYGAYETFLVRLDHQDMALLKAELHHLITDPLEAAPRATAMVKFQAPDWEHLDLKGDPNNEAPCVRRLKVPGGYLYQVAYTDLNSKWHPPVFVPDPDTALTEDLKRMAALNAPRD